MSDVAVRVDPATGVEERLEYVATTRGLLYSWTARPQEARSCVLICSSLFGDFTANYHRERLLGRALSARGLGVIRFHYAGEGNSQGDRRNMSFRSLCEDAKAVLNHAVSQGFTDFALLGTRLGALVAASVVPKPPAPLALWEPVDHPLRFIEDAQRASRISRLAQDRRGQANDWLEDLRLNGVLDLLGHDVYPPLIDSLDGVDLLTTIGSQPRPVFIARFRGRAEESDRLAEVLVDRGFSVESRHYSLAESWWFDSDAASESRDLLGGTTSWLARALTRQTNGYEH